ncbi:hypothetical protein ACFHW2_28390 [Actinomadura sp. LOL_016]|uniref:hypothetical protein n=1 Tax=unclassified Actinomadura TaxID=2626254 RepID=UPI003A8118E0
MWPTSRYVGCPGPVTVFAVIALLRDSVRGLAAGGARAWFARFPRRLAAIGGAGGTMMIGLGVGVAATGREV